MSKAPTILIVDDEPFNIDLLEQELGDLGYITIGATNGQEALDRVSIQMPDLILLDVMMPIMNGFEACQILKDNEATKLIPVIIMTALGATEDRIKGIEAGADDFLTKPVDDRELSARIASALKQKIFIETRISDACKIGDHYSKFVPEAVKKLVASNPNAPDFEKRDRDITVLFADITDYTKLSEELPREELAELVETYFAAYIDHISAAGGDVSGTAGDGLMAIFYEGKPEDHAIKAADTALALFSATADINRRRGRNPIELHAGMDAGIASVGTTRYEGLRGSRWVFTADGMIVNIASRLADIAQMGEIYMGSQLAHRLDGHFFHEAIGLHSLRNVKEPVEVYKLIGPVC